MRTLKWAVVAAIVVVVVIVGVVYLAPETAFHVATNLDRQRAGLVRKEIQLPEEGRLVYLEGGKGEPLLLLHGIGCNKDYFNRTARFLTAKYHVIAPDLLGFGESSRPPQGDYSPAAQARRLKTMMQALGIKGMDVAGHSMGGQVAMTYAALYPGEVKSLWLIDPAGIWSAPESDLEKRNREEGRNVGIVHNVDEARKITAYIMRHPPYIPGPLFKVMAQERIHNAALEERIYKQIMADSIEKRIRGITIPTLIVWGENDTVINPATAGILHKLLPNSQVIVMPDTGHFAMLERPERTVKDYLRFQRKLSKKERG
jgi:pimeloyl-ACP methyl ester carboxylesterase